MAIDSRPSAAAAPGCARAASGSATIGDSVPSKSSAISAAAGSLSSAARPSLPSAVRGRGSVPVPAAPVPVIGRRSSGPAVARVGARRPQPVPFGTLPPQPGDESGVEHECLRTVDELVQQLVVPRRGHPERVQDLLLLGAGRAPPAPLEGEDANLLLGQRRHLASQPPLLPSRPCYPAARHGRARAFAGARRGRRHRTHRRHGLYGTRATSYAHRSWPLMTA